MSHPFSDGIYLERVDLKKLIVLEPSSPSGRPNVPYIVSLTPVFSLGQFSGDLLQLLLNVDY